MSSVSPGGGGSTIDCGLPDLSWSRHCRRVAPVGDTVAWPLVFPFVREVVEHLFGVRTRPPPALNRWAVGTCGYQVRGRPVRGAASKVNRIVRPAVCTARRQPGGGTGVGNCGQATKGAGWMSWHREAMKDAVACDKPRRAGKRALTRGSLNEETQLGNPQLPTPERIGCEERTRGTETSHYPQEKKETSIPSVAASERGR